MKIRKFFKWFFPLTVDATGVNQASWDNIHKKDKGFLWEAWQAVLDKKFLNRIVCLPPQNLDKDFYLCKFGNERKLEAWLENMPENVKCILFKEGYIPDYYVSLFYARGIKVVFCKESGYPMEAQIPKFFSDLEQTVGDGYLINCVSFYFTTPCKVVRDVNNTSKKPQVY